MNAQCTRIAVGLRNFHKGLFGVCVAGSSLLACVVQTTSPDALPSVASVIAASGCAQRETGLPDDIFCTGLYVGHSPDRYAVDAMNYVPGATLWSDGAAKQRFLYLPPGAQIDTSNMDAWKFPVGTKSWKEFRLGGVLIETRFFFKRSSTAWESGTYIWDSSGTTAILNTAPKGIVLASGYEIPTAKDCDKCHHGGSDKMLGVEAVALALPLAQGTTLSVLAEKNLLSAPPASTRIAYPHDETGKAGPALAYLHANCGMACHSARGLGEETKLVLRLRAGEFWPGLGAVPATVVQTDIYRATLNQAPTTAAVAHQFPGAFRVTPGAHDKSLVWLVSHLRGNYQMPPLVSHKVDEAGTQQLAEWIDAL